MGIKSIKLLPVILLTGVLAGAGVFYASDRCFAEENEISDGDYMKVEISIDKSNLKYGEELGFTVKKADGSDFDFSDNKGYLLLNEEGKENCSLTLLDDGTLQGNVYYISPETYTIKGIQIDGVFLSSNNKPDFVVEEPAVEIDLEKKKVAFGEEIQASAEVSNSIFEYMELKMFTHGERLIFNNEDFYDIYIENGKKIKLLFSPGDYEIGSLCVADYTKDNINKAFSVSEPEEDVVFNNLTFDKKDVSVNDEVKIIIDCVEPFFSSNTEEAYIVLGVDKGGYGQGVYVENDGNGHLVGSVKVDDTFINGSYALKAFYGHYDDENGVRHYTYIADMFDTDINFAVSGSPENEEGGGAGGPPGYLNPYLLKSWKDDNESYRKVDKEDSFKKTISKLEKGEGTKSNTNKITTSYLNTDKNGALATTDIIPGTMLVAKNAESDSAIKTTTSTSTGDNDNVIINIFLYAGSLAGIILLLKLLSKNKQTK